MSEELEVILRAVDEASDTFQSVSDSVTDMAGSFEGVSDSTSNAADGIDGVAESGESAGDAMDSMTAAADLFSATTLVEFAQSAADALWDLADKAGDVQDSINRATLEAEGFGISGEEMKGVISDLADETGRTAGQIRESFIKATARGITDLDSFKTMMEGAGAQAYLLGTDIQSMANKFSSMAQKDTLMNRALAETGITMDELAEAMGMAGATADEVKDKWKDLDANQRAALLGQAAAMHEGEDANEAYKNSWQGLQDQIDKAKGKLEVMVGNVLLPVLIPALKAAGDVLSWIADVVSMVMSSPIGGLVSVLGAIAAGIVILVPLIAGLSAAWGFFSTAIIPAITASWALLAPWLPFIAVAVLVVAAIYEIGKAFGWWDDASGMIDAISAGLQRLWDAFINHPDVQAAIQVLSEAWDVLVEAVGNAWEAVTEFFGITDDGSFDIVRALIDGIGQAWNNIRDPVLAVINIIRTVLSVVWDVLNGNISVIDGIKAIWGSLVANMPVILNALFNVIRTIWQGILTTVSTIVRAVVNYVVNWFKQLPGKVYSALLGVVRSIVSAGQQWISNAKSKASSLVSNVVSVLSGLPGKIASALSGVVNAITKPFQDAYNAVSQKVDQIKNKINEVAGFSFGYDMGGPVAGYDLGTNTETLDINYNITLDLNNVPSGMSTEGLINVLTDKTVLSALTGNRDFQNLDAKVKARIASKQGRARGV